jgi:hypothetical protein
MGDAAPGTGQTTYTNGQLLIGNTTGNTLTKATLTAGSGIAVTNGTGSITVAASDIADSNISATAEIAVSKLADGTARQLLQTDAAGTGVEWTSNVDIPGTLDVTSTATFDSIASFPLGTAGAPTITFTGDTNTGIYSPGADQVAISTNGSGRLFVDSSGRVGIGAAPGAVFHITQSAADAVARIDGGSSNTAFVDFRIAGSNKAYVGLGGLTGGSNNDLVNYNSSAGNWIAYTNGSERMRLTSTGLLGLGTSSPNCLFEAKGGSAITTLTNSYSNCGILQQYSSSSLLAIGNDGTNPVLQGVNATNNTARNILLNPLGGSVGIGTTAPGTPLEVAGGDIRISQAGSGNVGLNILRTGGTTADWYQYIPSGSDALAWFKGTERMRLDGSGRLLVGTSNARANLFGSTGTSQFQVEGIGSDPSRLSVIGNFSTATNETSGFIVLGRSGASSLGSNTLVANNNQLGQISFQGADGSTFVQGASIKAEVDGTPGTNDMPGRLVFSTTADGASSPTERFRLDNKGYINCLE